MEYSNPGNAYCGWLEREQRRKERILNVLMAAIFGTLAGVGLVLAI